MTPPPPSGRQHELRAGELSAVVVAVGAGLRVMRYGDVDVLDGYAEAEFCTGARGHTLVPWPNRLAGGRFVADGEELQLPLTEPERGNAIHGLARWARWETVAADPSRCRLAHDVPPQPGWPFPLRVEVEYRLDAAGLTVTTTARNLGERPLPFGAGHHPYLSLGADRVDELTLRLPAAITLESDPRGIPTGRRPPVDGRPEDFRRGRRLGDTRLDTCYGDLERDADGGCHAEVRSDRLGCVLWVDAAHPYFMAFTGDTLEEGRRRRGLALEPMTCAPDAFNSGDGLRTVAPGAAVSSTWGIRLL